MQEHVLDDGIGALAVLDDLAEIIPQKAGQVADLGADGFGNLCAFQQIVELGGQLDRQAEKLMTKLSGFLISWAMPAVSWPSEASFSVWIRRSCAARKSSRDCASSRVRACTSSNRRTFS